MTLAEYLDTPETVLPRELAFGVLRVADSPRAPHQRLVGNLFLALAPYVREHGLGDMWLAPFDVILDVERALVVQPDLLFISAGRDIVREHVYGPPDLVIEVLSPHPRVGRLDDKVQWYGAYGVRECWLVHQMRREVDIITWPDRRMRRVTFKYSERLVSTVLQDLDRSVDGLMPDLTY